jgi:AcrR family transcriptional regulator
MRSPAQPAPRPYLAAAQRRAHLLDAAARLLRRRGWRALSMQGVAAEALVSRQLVYEHFGTVGDLHQALLLHVFEPAYEATRAIVGSGRGVSEVLEQAFALFLALPPDQRRAIRALATDDGPGSPELARAKRTLRARIADLWVDFVRRETGLDEGDAHALVWMLLVGAWGLSDVIADGHVGRERAVELFAATASQALAASRVAPARPRPAPPKPAPRPRRPRRSPDA